MFWDFEGMRGGEKGRGGGRHGKSVWNAKNRVTGGKDVGLTQRGVAEARRAGALLKAEGFTFDIAFTSDLARAQKTLELMLGELGQSSLETYKDQALNERDYGDLVGLNKAETAEKFGAEQVHIWRRSFDVAPPGGESLKDTAARTLPYFADHILPEIMAGKNVLVSAHGNSLRSIVMQLDNLSPDEVTQLELATGAPVIYRLNEDGSVADKRELAA